MYLPDWLINPAYMGTVIGVMWILAKPTHGATMSVDGEVHQEANTIIRQDHSKNGDVN